MTVKTAHVFGQPVAYIFDLKFCQELKQLKKGVYAYFNYMLQK